MSEIPALREYWYPIAYIDEVADTPVGAELFGDAIVVWRDAVGELHGALDVCPHRGARLSQG